MHQIDNSLAAVSLPTPAAVGPVPNGYFQLGTPVSSDWLNAVQMELINTLTAAGISPDKTLQNQLVDAINILITISPGTLSTDLDTAGYELTSAGSNDILLNPASGKVVVDGIVACTTLEAADASSSLVFGSGTQAYKVGATSIMNINSSGVQIGTGARISLIDADSTMAGNSSAAIPTQAAVKTYADTKAVIHSVSVNGFSDSAMSAGNTYYMSEGSAVSSVNAAYSFTMPFTGSMTNLYVNIDTAPGAGFSNVYTLMNASSATVQTVTIADGNFDAAYGGGPLSVTAGDVISLRCAIGAGAATVNRTNFSFTLSPP